MTTRTHGSAQMTEFTPPEQRTLRALRARYRQDQHFFSNAELARLRFLRWLCKTGRLI